MFKLRKCQKLVKIKKIQRSFLVCLLIYNNLLATSIDEMLGSYDGDLPPTYNVPIKRVGSHSYTDFFRNQGYTPTCTAFAVSYCLNYAAAGTQTSEHPDPYVSQIYLYLGTLYNDHQPVESGIHIENAFSFAKHKGVIEERAMYNHKVIPFIESNAIAKGRECDPCHFIRIRKLRYKIHFQDIKQVFAKSENFESKKDKIKKFLCALQVPVVVSVSTPGVFGFGSPDSRHSITIYGYDEGGFRVKNSWYAREDYNISYDKFNGNLFDGWVGYGVEYKNFNPTNEELRVFLGLM